MAGIRVAVIVVVALVVASCGADGEPRAERLCRRIERQRAMPVRELTVDEQLAEEAVQARIAPYEIADELALIAASHRAAAAGDEPVIPPSRLDAAEAEVARWVEARCGERPDR